MKASILLLIMFLLYACTPTATETSIPQPDPFDPTGSGEFAAQLDAGARAVQFNADGSLVLTYNNLDGSDIDSHVVQVWRTATREIVRTLRFDDESKTYVGAFSPDGRSIATGGDDIIDSKAGRQYNPVVVWDLATGAEVRRLRVYENAVRALSFSPDGTLLAFAGDNGYIGLWRHEQDDEVRRLDRDDFNRRILSMEFSRDGAALLTTPLTVWNVASGEQTVSGADKCYTFAGDASFVFGGGYNAIHAIDPQTGGTQRWLYEGNGLHITAVDVDGGGRYLATGYNDGSLKVWTIATKRLVCSLQYTGSAAAVTSVQFAPDASSLASVDESGILRFWRVNYQ